MPRFLLPNRSTPHRVAAIALYRALLSRCSSAPLPHEQCDSLRNAIRQKFRINSKLISPYQLGLSFRAGYETLDHLDAASSGNSSSVQFLMSIASAIPPRLKRPPPSSHPPPRAPHPSKQELACLPPEKAILKVRPYLKVSGPRHIPILCSANGIPFLRLKKPQPPSLSRVLRQKLDRRLMVFDRMVMFSNYWAPIARQEDEWDDTLRRELGFTEDTEDDVEVRWTNAVSDALSTNKRAHDRYIVVDKAIARNMQKIVDQETALALEEGQRIVRGRRRRLKPKSE